MPRKIRVRELSEEELSFLERASKSRDYKAGMRAEMVLLSSKERLSTRRMASKLDLHRHTVEDRIARFNDTGTEGLMRDIPSPGRAQEISEQEREAIFNTAMSKPNELGLPYGTWSSSKLRSYLVQNGLMRKISPVWMRQLLQEAGFKFAKARRLMVSNDTLRREERGSSNSTIILRKMGPWSASTRRGA